MFYTLLTIYNSLDSSKNEEYMQTIIKLISTLNDQIIYNERFNNENVSYHTIQDKTNNTHEKSYRMAYLGRHINLLKNNLSKSAIYDTRLTPMLKTSKIFLILSFLFLLVIITSYPFISLIYPKLLSFLFLHFSI